MYIHDGQAQMAKKERPARRPVGLVNDKQLLMRVTQDFLDALDDWRRKQPDIPGRSAAIRRLVELGMQAKGRR
jgi:hypothetical protein